MQQGLYRRDDPETAVTAAILVNQAIPRLEGAVLAELRRAGQRGMTSEELALAMKMPLVTVSPRLRPLANRGLVEDAGVRRPNNSGRKAIVWSARTIQRGD